MTRFSDWTWRLESFLINNSERPFGYGSWDCCMFVAGAIESITGVDLADVYRGRYQDRAQARDVALEIDGGPSVQDVAAGRAVAHQMAEVPVLRAFRGDMVLIKRPRDFSLGIVAMDGQRILIASKTGFGAIAIDRAVRAWRV